MSNQNIDATIFASSHPDIEKRKNVSVIVISGVLLLAGVIMLISTTTVSNLSASYSIALITVAMALIIWGAVKFLRNSKQMVYVPTGSVAKEECLFFDLKHLDTLKQCVNTGIFPAVSTLKTEDNGRQWQYTGKRNKPRG